MTEEHPFAQFVRIIGRGPNLSRPMTEEEMLEAGRMIMSGQVEPLQLGAFLCILRMRTEDPGEGAGFIRAVKECIKVPANAPAIDLDWSSYAGKKRHLPWFVLSALLLSQNGIKVLMHGTEGHTPGRIYTPDAVRALGIEEASSLADAAARLQATNFTYLPLANLVPALQDILDLKPILGLRSPANTFARMINPLDAPYSIQSIFHPNYKEVHRDTEKLLGRSHMCVFKGEGGEIERRPGKPVIVENLHEGDYIDEEWPALMEDVVREDEDLSLDRLGFVWRGEEENAYATAAVTGTAAIALRLMGRAGSPTEADALARDLWDNRNRKTLAA